MTRPYEKFVAPSLLGALIAVLLMAKLGAFRTPPQPPSEGEVMSRDSEEVMWRASVRLATGQGCTMIDTDGTTAFGVTADHCVGKIGSKVDIVVNGETLTGKVLSKNTELALIGVISKDIEQFASVGGGGESGGYFTFNETGKVELDPAEGGYFGKSGAVFQKIPPGLFELIGGDRRLRDSGAGVFQSGKLVGVITHANSTGVLVSPTLLELRDFVSAAMEIYPDALIAAKQLPAEKVAIAAEKTISTGFVPIQAIRVLDKESVLVVTAPDATQFVEGKLPRRVYQDEGTPTASQLRIEWSKWNVVTGRESLRITKEIALPVVLTMISPDGSWVGVCSTSTIGNRKTTDFGVVTIWNANSGQEIATWKTKLVLPISPIAISPSGKRIALVAVEWPPGAVGNSGPGSSNFPMDELISSLQVWCVPEGTLEKTLLTKRGALGTLGGFNRNGSHLSALFVTPNGKIDKTKSNNYATGIVWTTHDWRQTALSRISPWYEGWSFASHQLEEETVVFGRILFGGGHLELWNFRSGEKTRTLALGESPGLLLPSHSTESNYFAFKNSTGGGLFATKKRTAEIAVLDMESGLIFARLREPKSEATAFSFTKDGRQIISGSSDGGIRIWKLPSSR